MSESDEVRAWVLALLNERDIRYSERDASSREAVKTALDAALVRTDQRFSAQEKAIDKAEGAQRDYNSVHNDLARKMDEQNKATMPRSEIDSRFHSMDEKIADIRLTIGKTSGEALGGKSVKDESRANIALAVSVLALLMTVLAFAWRSGATPTPVQFPPYVIAPNGSMIPSAQPTVPVR